MKKVLAFSVIIISLFTGITSADTFGTGVNQFNIDFVTISGSTNPTSGYGIVNNDYRMGIYEITHAQWFRFKASIAPIKVTGRPYYAYDDDPHWTGTNVPTNTVSWYEAAQFVNWLNTSSGHQAAYKFSGTQGTSDYMLQVWQSSDNGYDASNPYRNSNAYYFLPTEDEWVKAAYWNGTNLQTYATIGDTLPVAGEDSNFDNAIRQPWDVGSGTEELNGTFDMMGNVLEWMESPYYAGIYASGSKRGIRGGYFNDLGVDALSSSARATTDPYTETDLIGFRVASVIPEPATLLLVGIGAMLIRKRKIER